jgi:hypothetical protein
MSKNIIKSILGFLVFGAVYTMLVVLEHIVEGIEISNLAIGISFLGGLIFACFLAWMVPKIKVRKLDFLLVVWLTLFIVQFANNIIEGFFFTTIYSSTFRILTSLLVCLVNTYLVSLVAMFLFYQKSENKFSSIFSDFFKQRKYTSWLWRIIVSSLAYFPIYFLFGLIVSPFVIPYYTGSSSLSIPSFTIITPLEFLRGFIYTISLLPLISLVKTNGRSLFVMLAAMLYIPGAFLSLIIGGFSNLPAAILPFHLLEILGDSIVYGYVMAYLLGKSNK